MGFELEALCSAAGWRRGEEREEEEEITEMPEDPLPRPAVNEGTTRGFGGTNFIGGNAERQVCHRGQEAREQSRGGGCSAGTRGHPRCASQGTAGTFWRQGGGGRGGEAPRGWGQAAVRWA